MMADEINILQLSAADEETVFQKELEELKTQLTVQKLLELKAELEAERKTASDLKAEAKELLPPEMKTLCEEQQKDTLEDESVEVGDEKCQQQLSVTKSIGDLKARESLNIPTSLNLGFSAELQAETEDDLPPERKTAGCEEQQGKSEVQTEENVKDKHKKEQHEQEGSLIPDLESTETTEVSSDTPPKDNQTEVSQEKFTIFCE
ncbi:hypothetical protein Q5P01_014600 [Channa striata]|uniref:Uncharacterized protein n=1 Tax=Channa striata TaxID=64152 RepID=A0AA88MJ30_CHASR|nr:hypothetical protein Q5P01_014600 [Channa striata]